MLKITYTKQAVKALRKMQPKKAKSIANAIERIGNKDTKGLNIIKREGYDDYRLRLGDYRVIYTIEGVILAIIKIGPRGDVYKK